MQQDTIFKAADLITLRMNNIKKEKCLKPLITKDSKHFSVGSNLVLVDPHKVVFL